MPRRRGKARELVELSFGKGPNPIEKYRLVLCSQLAQRLVQGSFRNKV